MSKSSERDNAAPRRIRQMIAGELYEYGHEEYARGMLTSLMKLQIITLAQWREWVALTREGYVGIQWSRTDNVIKIRYSEQRNWQRDIIATIELPQGLHIRERDDIQPEVQP